MQPDDTGNFLSNVNEINMDMKKYIFGGLALLAAFFLMKKPAAGIVPTGVIPQPATGSGQIINSAGQILSSLGQVLGLTSPPASATGAQPKNANGAASGGGVGPVGTAAPAPTSNGAQVTYGDGSYIDANNNYCSSSGAIIGYLAVDSNLYTTAGILIGDSEAGPDGQPDPSPENQFMYSNGVYIDDNGYLHQANGLVMGWVGTDGYIYDNSTPANIVGGEVPDADGNPSMDGPPQAQGNGYDQYGYPIGGSVSGIRMGRFMEI
jgi:hypothetical protein